MYRYVLTFGRKYSIIRHPIWPGLHSDGYIIIEADTHGKATLFVRAIFNTRYDEIVTESSFEEYKHLYPLGCLKILKVPENGKYDVGKIVNGLRENLL